MGPLSKPQGLEIAPATGRLGVLMVGLGSVATTFVAGIEMEKLNPGQLFGAKTEYGRIRIGRRDVAEVEQPLIKDFIDLVKTDDMVFGAWDIRSKNAYEVALEAGVLHPSELELIREPLSSLKPMTAVFEQDFVRGITDGDNLKVVKAKNKQVLQLMDDIRRFRIDHGCDRLVMLCVNSTERILDLSAVHMDTQTFGRGLDLNDPDISPTMIYAYAALMDGVPVINCTPNMTNIPALVQMAETMHAPLCGRDLKTGQTLLKTSIGPVFKSRALGMHGWYSDNILGNRDGLALSDEESFKAKEKTKSEVLENILEPELNPELFKSMSDPGCNQVHIKYYPPQGDSKIGMDQINFFGWMGKKMKLKIEIECEDSILAAGLCLDLVRFIDVAKRAKMEGVIEALSFYFKAPQTKEGVKAIHALFEQEIKLENWLRYLKGEELITYLGLDY
jgi:myo-inositol-1-phosphate synthase